jgi:hypothetical protein
LRQAPSFFCSSSPKAFSKPISSSADVSHSVLSWRSSTLPMFPHRYLAEGLAFSGCDEADRDQLRLPLESSHPFAGLCQASYGVSDLFL